MGKTAQETIREIDATREALGDKVDMLVDQMRDRAESAGRLGMKIAGGALAAAVVLLAWRRLRR